MKRRMLGATAAVVAVALTVPSGAQAQVADSKCGPTAWDCVAGYVEAADDVVDGVLCRIIARPCND